jgi:nitrite reductase (cytochrome c-552)
MRGSNESGKGPRPWVLAGIFAFLVAVGVGVGVLLSNITERQVQTSEFPLRLAEIPEDEVDPEAWRVNFPRHYDSFMRTRLDYGRTPYAGSRGDYDKLEANPFRRRAWAGYAFELEYNGIRGHYYAQIDQAESRRTLERRQPGTCLNCHAAEAPLLIEEMGWEEMSRTPYDSLRERVHFGSSCRDCHAPNTMELRISRQAFVNAMERRGVDVTQATRQEMRSYVCAQCHVEYYFRGENQVLTFPWDHGFQVEDIERHFDEYGFADWTHAETGAPMIKIQHPEWELYTTGTHYDAGVACADCHMPYTREGGVKVSDHWIRSPLTNLNNSCQTCHAISEGDLMNRVLTVQNRTAELLATAEAAITDLMDAIVEAREAGVADEALAEARRYHRRSQLRWDFIDAENSNGFHSPQESARILAHAADLARRGELSATRALARHRGATAAGAGTDTRP